MAVTNSIYKSVFKSVDEEIGQFKAAESTSVQDSHGNYWIRS